MREACLEVVDVETFVFRIWVFALPEVTFATLGEHSGDPLLRDNREGPVGIIQVKSNPQRRAFRAVRLNQTFCVGGHPRRPLLEGFITVVVRRTAKPVRKTAQVMPACSGSTRIRNRRPHPARREPRRSFWAARGNPRPAARVERTRSPL